VQPMTPFGPWWGALTIWGVVNAVNLLQAAGFVSRVVTGGRAVNHALGFAIIALAVPAAVAAGGMRRAGAGWLAWLGPLLFLAFVALSIAVDYVSPVEFRDPVRPGVLAPYLVLFFGSILLMGLPMFWLDRRLWLVTVGTTVAHLAAMLLAMQHGVG